MIHMYTSDHSCLYTSIYDVHPWYSYIHVINTTLQQFCRKNCLFRCSESLQGCLCCLFELVFQCTSLSKKRLKVWKLSKENMEQHKQSPLQVFAFLRLTYLLKPPLLWTALPSQHAALCFPEHVNPRAAKSHRRGNPQLREGANRLFPRQVLKFNQIQTDFYELIVMQFWVVKMVLHQIIDRKWCSSETCLQSVWGPKISWDTIKSHHQSRCTFGCGTSTWRSRSSAALASNPTAKALGNQFQVGRYFTRAN